ncbi:Carboxypeptidase B, partial [Plecturocebus cupreus]
MAKQIVMYSYNGISLANKKEQANNTNKAKEGGSCLYSQHSGRPRRADRLRPGVQGQPGKHSETTSLLKIEKLAKLSGAFHEKVFRVNVADENQINIIRKLASNTQIDFWKPDSVTQIKPHSTVDFHVKAEDAVTVENVLKQNELQYKLLISNLRNVLEAQFDSRVRATGHSYEKYNKWETIEAWTQQVATENPDLISRSVIGTTFEGRAMYLLKVGKAGQNKPAIFMDCGFHAREWISPAFCQWFVRE